MSEQPALMTAFLRFAALGAAGVAGAGTASASTAHRGTFCTAITAGSAGFCAIAEGASQPVRMLQDPQQNSSPTTWAYPIQGGYQQILNGNLSLLEPLCMQLDHAKSNEVIEAKCNGASYQKWQGASVVENGKIVSASYVSQWNKNLCLTYNESKEILDAVTCNSAWYQVFGS